MGICNYYMGSHQPSGISLANPLLLSLSYATYAESHYQVDGNKQLKRWSGVQPYPGGVAEIIFDMDKMVVADLYMPNWFFGTPSICGYPAYGAKETPGVELSLCTGRITGYGK